MFRDHMFQSNFGLAQNRWFEPRLANLLCYVAWLQGMPSLIESVHSLKAVQGTRVGWLRGPWECSLHHMHTHTHTHTNSFPIDALRALLGSPIVLYQHSTYRTQFVALAWSLG